VATLCVAWANFVRLHVSSQAVGVTEQVEPIDGPGKYLEE